MERQAVARVARKHGASESLSATIAAHARLAMLLVAAGPPRGVGATKGGGRPDLPAGVAWPVPSREGLPLVFLMQLRLADLRDGVLDEMALRPELVWTVPTESELLRIEPSLEREEDEYGRVSPVGYEYDAIVADLVGKEWHGHRDDVQAQLLGWAGRGEQGGEVEAEVGEMAVGWQSESPLKHAPWRLLLEIPSSHLVPSFGDGGEGWIALPAQDLAAARWDRAFCGCETG